MDFALSLGAVAAKLTTVTPVASAILAVGAVLGVAGWGWLIFQNARFGVVHGVLSIIPIYALVYAFVGLEHRHKELFTAAFLGGAVIAGLGYLLVFAADDCENNAECGIRRNLSEEVAPPSPEEGSSLLVPLAQMGPSD